MLLDLVGHLLPPGVLNVVNGFGPEAGAALASSKRIAKIAFTGSTIVGRQIAAAAAKNLIPATLELGGKSPNLFFSDIMAADDALFDKALEGFAMFAFNSGEVCTCPSRALVQEDIFDAFMARALPRVAAIRMGNPLDVSTAMGAQNSTLQLNRILKHIDGGKAEGAEALIGGAQAQLPGSEAGGYYVQPTVFKGHNKMRIFQDEIFGPVLAVCTFKDEAEAIAIANDSSYGLGAGLWTRDVNRQFRVAKAIKAGRVWCVVSRASKRACSAHARASAALQGQLLPRVPRRRSLRRLQGVWHRPRDAQDCARRVPAGEEHAGVVLPQRAGLLLKAHG